MKGNIIPGIMLLAVVCINSVFTQSTFFRSDMGSVHFKSDAPLEFIEAQSDKLAGIINPHENTYAFSIDISSFDGFNSPLQKTHFNENYLESVSYPTASFTGKIIESVDWGKNGTCEIRAKGTLKIHGIEHERIIRSTLEVSEEELLIHSEFTVSLRDHDIAIPKIVAQKISDIIQVEVEIRLPKHDSN